MNSQRGAIHLAESAQWLAARKPLFVVAPYSTEQAYRGDPFKWLAFQKWLPLRKNEHELFASDIRWRAAQLAFAWDAQLRLKQAA